MIPWAVIARIVTPIATAVAGRFLTDPNTVNKLANSGLIRQLARSAARLRVQAEKAIENQPEIQKFVDKGFKDVKPEISKFVKGEITRKAKKMGRER